MKILDKVLNLLCRNQPLKLPQCGQIQYFLSVPLEQIHAALNCSEALKKNIRS